MSLFQRVPFFQDYSLHILLFVFRKILFCGRGLPKSIWIPCTIKGTKYHLPEFRHGPRPSGKKEVFNFVQSLLRNVIERSFGILKMKWRILLGIPAYPMRTQSKIILACMALHSFIRESALADADFNV